MYLTRSLEQLKHIIFVFFHNGAVRLLKKYKYTKDLKIN